MNSYIRPLENKPTKLCDDDERKKLYKDLYDEKGDVKPRWNTMRENGKRIVRQYLLSITNGTCIYCGKKINDSDMDVEHFLPKSVFPYLSYCLENLLPSCKRCNQNYKKDFVPKDIKDKKIIEDCMKDSETYDYIYNKEEMLNNICRESRIIEPTFDDINNHLEFDPEFFFYRTKSNMGENTNLMFFDKPEFIEELEKMSEVVRKAVKNMMIVIV